MINDFEFLAKYEKLMERIPFLRIVDPLTSSIEEMRDLIDDKTEVMRADGSYSEEDITKVLWPNVTELNMLLQMKQKRTW